jgi:hypothetical protein
MAMSWLLSSKTRRNQYALTGIDDSTFRKILQELPDEFNCFRCNNSLQLSPSWEANSSWLTEQVPHPLWNPNVYYSVYRSLPDSYSEPYKSNTHLARRKSTLMFSFSLTSRPSAWSLPFVFANQNFVCILIILIRSYILRLFHTPSFTLISGEEYKLWRWS